MHSHCVSLINVFVVSSDVKQRIGDLHNKSRSPDSFLARILPASKIMQSAQLPRSRSPGEAHSYFDNVTSKVQKLIAMGEDSSHLMFLTAKHWKW